MSDIVDLGCCNAPAMSDIFSYSVTSHKFVLDRTSVYMCGEEWRQDLVKGRMDRKFSVMVWGCICYNGVGTLTQDGREYKC
jgi:hypothetical protein